MNVMLVDRDLEALNRAAKRLTEQKLAISVFIYQDADDALYFAIDHKMDVVFARESLETMTGAELSQKIMAFHRDTACFVLQDDEDFSVYPFEKTKLLFCGSAGGIPKRVEPAKHPLTLPRKRFG